MSIAANMRNTQAWGRERGAQRVAEVKVKRVARVGDEDAPSPGSFVDDHTRARRIERVRKLAVLMDGAYRIPGTNRTVGIDPILGLFEGVGDAISAGVSLYIVYECKKLGASKSQMRRMLANVAIDTIVGLVPIAGDLFDFGFKANLRNLRVMGIDQTTV